MALAEGDYSVDRLTETKAAMESFLADADKVCAAGPRTSGCFSRANTRRVRSAPAAQWHVIPTTERAPRRSHKVPLTTPALRS